MKYLKMSIVLLLVSVLCMPAMAADRVRIYDNNGVDLILNASGSFSTGGHASTGSGYQVHTGNFTATALGSAECKRMVVKAALANTGDVYLGDSTVQADLRNGVPLDAGEVWVGFPDNIGDIYISGTVTGERVMFTYSN